MSPQHNSTPAFSTQDEHDVRSWIGFSTNAPTTSNSYSYFTPKRESQPQQRQSRAESRPYHYKDTTDPYMDLRTKGATTPPIPDRAPERLLPKYTNSPRLKRKSTPRSTSLRDLRAKASESALRAMYEAQTNAYLSDPPKAEYRARHSRHSTKWSLSESSGEEDIKEDPEE